MTYPQDYMHSIITISSVLIAVAGILIAIRVNRDTLRNAISQLLLFSIFPGIGALVFAQWWFAIPVDGRAIVSILFLSLQLILVMVPLFLLVYSSSRKQ
ncbi:MAG: hypothetical protein ACFFDI_32860 [Promethearchaeota archaeon]